MHNTLEEMARELVRWNGGKVTRVARCLNVSRPTLYAIMSNKTQFETQRVELAVKKSFKQYRQQFELIQASVLLILRAMRRAMVHCPALLDDADVLSRLCFLLKTPSVPEYSQIGYDVVSRWVDNQMPLEGGGKESCRLIKAVLLAAIDEGVTGGRKKALFVDAFLVLIGLSKISVNNQSEMKRIMHLSKINVCKWTCEIQPSNRWYDDPEWQMYINRIWFACQRDGCSPTGFQASRST